MGAIQYRQMQTDSGGKKFILEVQHSVLMATSQKCDLGIVLEIFTPMLPPYSLDVGVWQHYARASQHDALQLAGGTVT